MDDAILSDHDVTAICPKSAVDVLRRHKGSYDRDQL